MTRLTPIIKRALTRTVVDIGQLSCCEMRELKQAVRDGILDKGKGGGFPIIKTVYAVKGYDFERDRRQGLHELELAHAMDVARGVVRR